MLLTSLCACPDATEIKYLLPRTLPETPRARARSDGQGSRPSCQVRQPSFNNY